MYLSLIASSLIILLYTVYHSNAIPKPKKYKTICKRLRKKSMEDIYKYALDYIMNPAIKLSISYYQQNTDFSEICIININWRSIISKLITIFRAY